jgi:hypothetical protein
VNSSLGQNIGYPDWHISWAFSVSLEKFGDSSCIWLRSFHFSSSFKLHSIFRRHLVQLITASRSKSQGKQSPHTLYPIYLRCILLISSHLHLFLPTCIFLWGYLTKILCIYRLFHAPCMLSQSHLPWFNYSNNILWGAKIMKLLIMHLSPPFFEKWKISNLYSLKFQ